MVALSDENGSIVQRYAYDAYGKRSVLGAAGTPTTAAALTRYGFIGREHEEGFEDLMYFRSRYFHATKGRFISHDVDYLDGLNLYGGYFGMWGGVDPRGEFEIALDDNATIIEVSTQHFDSDSYRIYRNTWNDLEG